MFTSFTARRSALRNRDRVGVPGDSRPCLRSDVARDDAREPGRLRRLLPQLRHERPSTAPVGNVQITTSPATSPGFHAVRVGIKIRGGQVPAGTYKVWLVNLYRDDTGQVIGCAASPLSSEMTVKNGGVNFHAFADRYSGQYELKVYVGPIWGPGYGSSPSMVDVP